MLSHASLQILSDSAFKILMPKQMNRTVMHNMQMLSYVKSSYKDVSYKDPYGT